MNIYIYGIFTIINTSNGILFHIGGVKSTISFIIDLIKEFAYESIWIVLCILI